MSYHLNLDIIPIEEYKTKLINDYLIPSQRPLKDNIDKYFKQLSTHKINTMHQLTMEVRNKESISNLSILTDIPETYLTLLGRSIRSLTPTPRKVDDYTMISPKTKDLLISNGIINSKKLYEYITTTSSKELEVYLDISEDELKLIYSLMDVSRLRYVSPVFATALILCGYESIEDIAHANAKIMYQQMITVNESHKVFKGNIGENDMLFLIEDSKFFIRWL